MRRGQSILEYLLIFAVVSAAILGMQVYAKRGVQAIVKTAADQMSPVTDDADGRKAQVLGVRQESGDMQKGIDSGSVLEKNSSMTSVATQRREIDGLADGGRKTRDEVDSTETTGTSFSRVVAKVKKE